MACVQKLVYIYDGQMGMWELIWTVYYSYQIKKFYKIEPEK